MKPELERIDVRAAGHRVVFRRRAPSGERSRMPAVLLHALAGSWRWWRGVAAHLDRERELWLPDLPGFGASSGRPAGPGADAAIVAEALERLGAGRVHVAGHSLGGAVAAELAARFPACVGSLTLVDAAGWPSPLFPRYLGRLAQPWSWCRPGFLPTLVSDVVRTRPDRLAAAIRHLLGYDIRPALRSVAAPACVVWGERDRLLPPAQGKEMARILGGARFERVAGAGHIVPGDRPAELARILDEFWGDV